MSSRNESSFILNNHCNVIKDYSESIFQYYKEHGSNDKIQQYNNSILMQFFLKFNNFYKNFIVNLLKHNLNLINL